MKGIILFCILSFFLQPSEQNLNKQQFVSSFKVSSENRFAENRCPHRAFIDRHVCESCFYEWQAEEHSKNMRYRRGKRRETQNYIFMPTNTTLFKGQFKSDGRSCIANYADVRKVFFCEISDYSNGERNWKCRELYSNENCKIKHDKSDGRLICNELKCGSLLDLFNNHFKSLSSNEQNHVFTASSDFQSNGISKLDQYFKKMVKF